MWSARILENVLITSQFSTACLQLSSKLCFVYIEVSADKYAEESLWNISLSTFCNSLSVLVELCSRQINGTVVNLVYQRLKEGCRFFTKELFHVFNAEYVWSSYFFNCSVSLFLWLAIAVEWSFCFTCCLFNVCGIVTVWTEEKCIITNF